MIQRVQRVLFLSICPHGGDEYLGVTQVGAQIYTGDRNQADSAVLDVSRQHQADLLLNL
jgi:hypothetical protein